MSDYEEFQSDEAIVANVYPSAYAQSYSNGTWAILVPAGPFINERIGEGEDEEAAWSAAAEAIAEEAEEAAALRAQEGPGE